MLSTAPLLQTDLDGLALHRRGKVRDVYEIGDELLIVATDRISAFDYVLGSGIPDKGKVLTQLSGFWFERMGDLVPHHLISMEVEEFPAAARAHADQLRGRTMLVRRTDPIPIECVARGYLSGSGWKEYQQSGCVCGIELPRGLRESDRLPEPIFTPATKADTGHDINISEGEAGRLIGEDLIATLKALTLEIYSRGVAHAESKGIIIADTKFEFGLATASPNSSPSRRLVRRSAQREGGRREGDGDCPHRRGPDAGLVPLLAAGSLRGGPRTTELRQAVRPRLSRRDQVEQAAAGAVAARRRHPAHPRQVCRSVSRAERQRAAVAVREQLDSLVQQMLDRGVRYEDARREFEKVFITRALQRSNGCLGDAAELLGIHRNTVTRKMAEIQDQAPLTGASSQRRES